MANPSGAAANAARGNDGKGYSNVEFHLATIDLRQSSDHHEAVVAELLRVARNVRDGGPGR